MARIGLLADTHGFLDPRIFDLFGGCDEIWHAGDFGDATLARELAAFKRLRGVHGNIDDPELRGLYPRDQRFECAGLDVWMTHIGGYPGRYDPRVRAILRADPPQLFVCGHSHILRVMRDRRHRGLLYLNPGAAGRQGFHQVRTMLRFEVRSGCIQQMQVVELGPRHA
jgi:putative phosphoesterase